MLWIEGDKESRTSYFCFNLAYNLFIAKVKSVYHGLSRFLFFERLRSILKLLKGLGLSCVKSFFQ